MSLDLSQLSPSDIASLKAMLAGTDDSGRSPIRDRQLHDLRLLPTKDDPRPTFFWSAEQPRNAGDLTKTSMYPRLMWHSTTGQEITVKDVEAQETHTAKGFILTPPANAEAPDPMEAIRLAFESLSPEDRATLVAAQQKSRLDTLQAQMAELSEADLEALIAGAPKVKKSRVA